MPNSTFMRPIGTHNNY